MNILAIDTAGPVLSAALSSGGGIRSAEINAGTRHSELLMELVDGLFRSAGIKSEELELVSCMKGPGSFTGLRIGYAAAKGISLALGIPLAAVPTLDCIAEHLSAWPGLVLPAIDAKKNRFFTAFYRQGILLGPYLDSDPENILSIIEERRLDKNEPVILTGPGAEMLFPLLSGDLEALVLDPFSRAGRARELLDILKKGSILYIEEENSGPLYLRKSDAELTVKS